MLNFYDLTLPISENTLLYPGDSAPLLAKESDIKKGDDLTASHLSINCHVGTHVDGPAHFLGDGETLDELGLERFHGPALVCDFPDCDVITLKNVQNFEIPECHHILLKTKNSTLLQQETFLQDYCTLSPEAAEWLCEHQPLSVGIDYYSLDPYQGENGFPAHLVLARAGIPVYVCLNLQEVSSGPYVFSGFPLRLFGTEASPVRAVLMKTCQE